MSSGEAAPNPQPPLYQTLQEAAELVNYLDEPGFNITDIPVPGALYEFNRQRTRDPNSDRATITLGWSGQGKLLTSDGRWVTSMDLDVPKSSSEASRELVQTYQFGYELFPKRYHDVAITVHNDQQEVSIVEDRSKLPPHWLPMSGEDTERMITIFHDALQDGKRLHNEKVQETRDHNELLRYVKERRPDGFPDETSQS